MIVQFKFFNSPSATNSTVTAISQQKWTSPLGSAFAAPQTSNAPMFYAPAGPSQSQIQQNQQQIQVVINDKITVGPPISI
jgi:hypothetical protein